MARLITKKVVACCLSFLSLVRATTVRRLPATPTRPKKTAEDAAKTVNNWENSTRGGLAVPDKRDGLSALGMRLCPSIAFIGPAVHNY